ncbi:hypothetical protein VDQ66_21235, partial [Xanthomonas campestris pv. campestris]|nr:hypothetical protein [Xanthomonas campestris pv. campestris]
HARTFFQAITSQVIDLPGGNVGKPQVRIHFFHAVTRQRSDRPTRCVVSGTGAALPFVADLVSKRRASGVYCFAHRVSQTCCDAQ